ncbi:Emopamil binding protein-domain-containing protein [Podospora didyma]|uniref:Emopamil binding protein-domain-containing protein n=1 Tax=Podospora didyma TaxID=330526 RepID=A0AAE0KFH5_9PEZI|nr:Emopamil binding protein-domain-containing protein [Podospora didyma]KAK3375217.1 Emopamil binding protein-domain-containing protein [Podospora didyma]
MNQMETATHQHPPHSHPYYPVDSMVPGYAPNESHAVSIIARFGGLIAAQLVLALWVAERAANPGRPEGGLGRSEQAVLCWFVLSHNIGGFLHCFFEGYFVVNHATMPSSQALFAQLWKEYALSDSRYMTSDPFMLCIESLTVLIWGPLSYLLAGYIAFGRGSGENLRRRHILQVILCIGHMYGVALYYGTCFFVERHGGISFSRPEVLYQWVYFAGLNAPWAVVPAMLLYQSFRAIGHCRENLGEGDSAALKKIASSKKDR